MPFFTGSTSAARTPGSTAPISPARSWSAPTSRARPGTSIRTTTAALLPLANAYLQGVDLHDANLTGADAHRGLRRLRRREQPQRRQHHRCAAERGLRQVRRLAGLARRHLRAAELWRPPAGRPLQPVADDDQDDMPERPRARPTAAARSWRRTRRGIAAQPSGRPVRLATTSMLRASTRPTPPTRVCSVAKRDPELVKTRAGVLTKALP